MRISQAVADCVGSLPVATAAASVLWITLFCVTAATGDTAQECKATAGATTWASYTSHTLPAADVALFPLGAIEQHGPHLPLGTDMFLAESFALSLSTGRAIALPPSPFGASFEHARFRGTVAVPDEPLQHLWESVLSSVRSSGIRKAVLLNGHGGQTPNAAVVARALRFRGSPPMLVVVVELQSALTEAFAEIAAQHNDGETEDVAWEAAYGIHGGLVETSVMLHLKPEIVEMDLARRFEPRPAAWMRELEPYGRSVSFGWETQDIAKCGALGNAAKATAELGERLYESVLDRLRNVLKDVHDVDVDKTLVDSKPSSWGAC